MIERLFIDTVFIQALLNKADQYHSDARRLATKLRSADVWVTEAVLIEVGNALAGFDRAGAAQFIRSAYRTPNIRVVACDSDLLHRALDLYESREDKSWGLTDCISFVVMKENEIHDALTADQHFVQAGFRVLLSHAS